MSLVDVSHAREVTGVGTEEVHGSGWRRFVSAAGPRGVRLDSIGLVSSAAAACRASSTRDVTLPSVVNERIKALQRFGKDETDLISLYAGRMNRTRVSLAVLAAAGRRWQLAGPDL